MPVILIMHLALSPGVVAQQGGASADHPAAIPGATAFQFPATNNGPEQDGPMPAPSTFSPFQTLRLMMI